MDKNDYNKVASFWQLISTFPNIPKIEKIEIPIIQRDFAQGRDNNKTNKIRKLFLDSLMTAVESNNDSLELDFVYGNIKDNVFQPLDGQQRLTTLFLLHWYLAYKTENLEENKNHFKKFTYETRISSREFCNELVENGRNLGTGKDLTEKIKDASWFFLAWGKDPTIKAMLVMLNSIENRLKEKKDEELTRIWEKLISEDSPITFHFIELKDIGLTDDLYIKMNARGKALSEFENFKARFEKYIEKSQWEAKELKSNETFSHKIDTVWTDLFWKHRGADNVIDDEFMAFIAGIAINAYAQNREILRNEKEELKIKKLLEEKKVKNITDAAVKRERIEQKIALLSSNPNELSPEDFPSQQSFNYLKDCLDIYSDDICSDKSKKYDELVPENLKQSLTLWDFLENQNSLFVKLVRGGATYPQRVLFYAQTQFLLQAESLDREIFAEWMRVVRNIVQNSTIENATYIGAIALVNELLSGCTDIYSFLNEDPIKSDFASKQVQEEILKASLIQQDTIWKNQIFKVEDDNFLRGEISFLLEFAENGTQFDYKRFKGLSDNFLRLFAERDDLLRISLLTQADYRVWHGKSSSLGWIHRYSLLGSEGEWKKALREKHEKLFEAILKLLEFAKENEGKDREKKLETIISNYVPNNDYRDLLILDPKYLANCSHKKICLSNDNSILYILYRTNVVGKNYEEVKINS